MDAQSFLTTVGVASDSGNNSGGERVVDIPKSISNDGTAGNFLSAASTAPLLFTNTDTVIFGCWVNLSAVANNAFFAYADAADGLNKGYYVSTDGSGNFDVVYFVGGGLAEVTASAALSTNTKYFLLSWIDPSTKTLNIKINSGTVSSYDYSAAESEFTLGAGTLYLGNTGDNNLILNGSLDEAFICKNPSDLTTALETITTAVYAGGTGHTFSGVNTSDKTTIGLQNWWTLDEDTAADRSDSQGSVTLTPTGTVTQATAIVS